MSIVDYSYRLPGGPVGILLAHGMGGHPAELRYVALGLSRAGYTVHVCQLAGHCGSLEELAQTGWQDWSRSLAEAHDRLREDCDIVLAGGMCLGAMLSLRLAIDRPDEVAGLALFSPALNYDGWAVPWYDHALRVLMRTPLRHLYVVRQPSTHGLKDERVRQLMLSYMQSGSRAQAGLPQAPAHAFHQFAELNRGIVPRLGEVKAPALIVHGREDDMSSLKGPFLLQRKLGGLVETLVLDDSYHFVTLDRQRDLVLQQTRGFAERIVRRSQRGNVRRHYVQAVAAE